MVFQSCCHYLHLFSRLLVCLFNELATRWSERSVPVSFNQMIFMMYIPHPVTSRKTSRYMACSPIETSVLLLILQTHHWGDAIPSDVMLHYSLLRWGPVPSRLSVTFAWGENKTLCIQTHPLSNQLISCWDGAENRRMPEEDVKSYDLPLGFFPPPYILLFLPLFSCWNLSSSQ